ncbi:hypothetical protein GCM10010271_37870 [Streptomyces kurssanovii]|nr:hypothetical protein GCM10010271_37870 [Streptomyces kurssanovii]
MGIRLSFGLSERICMPCPVGGTRGAGLGNEIFPWAKAYLASRELGFRLLGPAWGLSGRGYWREFGTSRLDWAGHAALRAVLPTATVTAGMVRATRETDYGSAIRVLDAEFGWSKQHSLVLLHEGMSGGFHGIARARDFLRMKLLGHLPHPDAHHWSADPPRLHVAVHARLGDFSDGRSGPQPGDFNTCLPAQWYRSVLDAMRRAFGDALHVDILTDAPDRAARLLPEYRNNIRRRTALQDLSVMAAADLLICSVSSFSMLAAFLSDAPYVWYRPHLGETNGFLSIWGHEVEHDTILTAANISTESQDAIDVLPTRGIPMDVGDDLPNWLTQFMRTKLALNRRSADLIHYGVVPLSREPLPSSADPAPLRPQPRGC